MRSFFMAVVMTVTLMSPLAARAGWLVEGSAGIGAQVSPSPVHREQWNLMVTPGYLLPIPLIDIGLQLGAVFAGPDSDNRKTNIELRPMLMLKAPVLPIYGRVIMAVNNLMGRDGLKREYAFGAAGGLRFGLGPIGVFAEAGVLPRSRDFGAESKFAWILEGRGGAYLEF
jgi:hypothetical protein